MRNFSNQIKLSNNFIGNRTNWYLMSLIDSGSFIVLSNGIHYKYSITRLLNTSILAIFIVFNLGLLKNHILIALCFSIVLLLQILISILRFRYFAKGIIESMENQKEHLRK